MKIGILTIHAAYNYGSALQAVASCQAIKEITGSVTEIIDYQPDSIMSMYSLDLRKNVGGIKEFIKFIFSIKSRKQKKKAFDLFWKKENCLSKNIYYDSNDLFNANDVYDSFVVGSDQVWNPDIVGDAFGDFCLEFVSDDKNRYAYASSFGVRNIGKEQLEKLNLSLKKFKAIAVREREAKNMLDLNIQKHARIVCDPVFLLTKDQWRNRMIKMILPSNYILVYCVEVDKELQTIIKEMSRRLELPIVDVGYATNPQNYMGMHNDNVGPGEFLYAINNAEYVITNSFHGTAFSIIFRKQFLVKAHSKRGVRMENILDICGLSDRMVREDDELDKVFSRLTKINPERNDNLDSYIQNSKEYISSMFV